MTFPTADEFVEFVNVFIDKNIWVKESDDSFYEAKLVGWIVDEHSDYPNAVVRVPGDGEVKAIHCSWIYEYPPLIGELADCTITFYDTIRQFRKLQRKLVKQYGITETTEEKVRFKIIDLHMEGKIPHSELFDDWCTLDNRLESNYR